MPPISIKSPSNFEISSKLILLIVSFSNAMCIELLNFSLSLTLNVNLFLKNY